MIKVEAITTKQTHLRAAAAVAIGRGLDRAARVAQSKLKQQIAAWEHHVSFVISTPAFDTRDISTNDPVFIYQDEGTKKHIILPRNRSLLRFRPAGAATDVFARRVRHPGTKAMGYSKRVAEQMGAVLAQEISGSLQEVIP